ncbi:restriction endonuclease subunit S [Vibrio toranzoniae]|nr:restriction endonuclease subunit S [Vibrio toranzoniae]
MFSLKRSLVGSQSSNYQLLSLTLKGVIPRDISSGEGKIPENFDTYQKVDKNDLIFCLFDIDETPRTIGISPLNGMITGAYNVYGCLDHCSSDYAYYYFFHIDSFKGLKPFYTGLRKVVRAETFSNIEMPCPSFEEQQKIANFLDHETAKIDTLITKQEKLIELLKEKRQAVISHAVTKGLNPDAPMKDSGVEWLGEVPEHWIVSQIKYGYEITLGKMLTKEPKSQYYELKPYLKAVNVQPNGVDVIKVDKMWFSPKELKSLRLKHGDVLISEGGDVGRAAIWEAQLEECYIQNALNRARPINSNSSTFLLYWMKFLKHTEYIDIICNKATIAHYTAEKVEASPLIIPPLMEQQCIAQYLNKQSDKFDLLTNKAQQAIQLMKERKTALISAAVTGKIDVRDWQGEA